MFHYEIYLDGELLNTSKLEGLAILMWQSAEFLGVATLKRVFSGPEAVFDPVLHSPCKFHGTDRCWVDA
jgi:hypothetical protein